MVLHKTQVYEVIRKMIAVKMALIITGIPIMLVHVMAYSGEGGQQLMNQEIGKGASVLEDTRNFIGKRSKLMQRRCKAKNESNHGDTEDTENRRISVISHRSSVNN